MVTHSVPFCSLCHCSVLQTAQLSVGWVLIRILQLVQKDQWINVVQYAILLLKSFCVLFHLVYVCMPRCFSSPAAILGSNVMTMR
jgi:hypothetical protein